MSGQPDVTLQSGDATLTFFWVEDRYQHYFLCSGSTLESLQDEGCESPVYTDPHEQDGMLFLSGNAGIGHWSACVEADGSDGFVFDVALRLNQRCGSLASLYTGDAKVESVADAAVTGDEITRVTQASAIGEPVCTIHYKYKIGPAE